MVNEKLKNKKIKYKQFKFLLYKQNYYIGTTNLSFNNDSLGV